MLYEFGKDLSMKKTLMVLMIISLFGLLSCKPKIDEYSDDLPFVLSMDGDSLKILQLTDLHLMSSADVNTQNTLDIIDDLVTADDYDLVVISGDAIVSYGGPNAFVNLIDRMEALAVPWTFVFGNHETDHFDYQGYLDKIENTEFLYFKTGPEMTDGGVGNFRINFTKNSELFYSLYFFDSHTYGEIEEYGNVFPSQVDWYETHVSDDVVNSIAFMHIPLRQFISPTEYEGTFGEPVCPQGIDTGLFAAMVAHGKTVGVFVGHDHSNDYTTVKESILLAYGRKTGENSYGDLPRGGRVIVIDEFAVMTTYIVER
jgi:3',5'-cyclic AMP phosphodiesterase CpdA